MYYDKMTKVYLVRTARQIVDDSAMATESKLLLAVRDSQKPAKGEEK